MTQTVCVDINDQSIGFTLIELMIALNSRFDSSCCVFNCLSVVRLIIAFKPLLLLPNSVCIFGVLGYVTKNIRLANHGNTGAMNDESL